jgi:hypothetical protein
VVDPGVGNFEDPPIILKLDNRWFVGPDNGLFDIVARAARKMTSWEITWRPNTFSKSFHGRDIYAPVCAMLAKGEKIPGNKSQWQDRHNWPDDLYEVIYVDHFGNCITGVGAGIIKKDAVLVINGKQIGSASTLSDLSQGVAFWYENSNGLIEIALNQGKASTEFGLEVGRKLNFI